MSSATIPPQINETTVPMPLSDPMPLSLDQTIVAGYRNHPDAESAVRLLGKEGLPMDKISIIGRNFETREDVQGFYRPADAALDGATTGAWLGGLFGLLLGMGLFIVPVVGAVLILGPLAGLVAGAIGGAGVGALLSALVSLGMPQDEAIKYQARLQSGEFLVVVHGATAVEAEQARTLLQGTQRTTLQTHSIFHGGAV